MSPGPARAVPEVRTNVVVVAPEREVESYPTLGGSVRYAGYTTAEALRLIETARPRIVVIDWDGQGIDGTQVCTAARKFAQTGVLVTLADPESAPAALKAGCHAVLLKPIVPNLIAARMGRLARELPATPMGMRAAAALHQNGTNRVWPETRCPKCETAGATSFEFHSYRRMWYACLGCDHVWLGVRQE